MASYRSGRRKVAATTAPKITAVPARTIPQRRCRKLRNPPGPKGESPPRTDATSVVPFRHTSRVGRCRSSPEGSGPRCVPTSPPLRTRTGCVRSSPGGGSTLDCSPYLAGPVPRYPLKLNPLFQRVSNTEHRGPVENGEWSLYGPPVPVKKFYIPPRSDRGASSPAVVSIPAPRGRPCGPRRRRQTMVRTHELFFRRHRFTRNLLSFRRRVNQYLRSPQSVAGMQQRGTRP